MEKMGAVTSQGAKVSVTLCQAAMAQTTVAPTHFFVFPGSDLAFPITTVILSTLHTQPSAAGISLTPRPFSTQGFLGASQSGKIRKQWDYLSYQPLGSLQALVNAACSCKLVTPSLRRLLSPNTQSAWETRIPDAQVSKTPGQAQTLHQPTPPHPHSHPALICEESNPWRVTQISCHCLSPEAFSLWYQSNAKAKHKLMLNYSHQANIVSHILLIPGSTYNYPSVSKANQFLLNIVAIGPCCWLQSLVGSFAHGIYPILYHPRSIWSVSLPLPSALTIVQVLCLPPFSLKETFSARLGWSHNSSMESCSRFPEKTWWEQTRGLVQNSALGLTLAFDCF